MSSIGELLFNRLYILFISAAFLLFIAMIGAIILTMDEDLNLEKNMNIIKKEQRYNAVNIN
jgi:hypothetical protein